MDDSMERLGVLAGLVAAVSVGVPVLVDQFSAGGQLLGPWAGVWWPVYLGYLVVFGAFDTLVRRAAWLTERRLLAVQGLLGSVAVAVAPQLGWTAVLLVVTVVTAAAVLSPRGAIGVLVAHTVLLLVVGLRSGHPPVDVTLGAVVYGALQAFGVFMVWAAQREARAREELGAAHAELRATAVLLEESGRTGERLRIARELHDLVGHQLTALALELEVASHQTAPPAREHVTRARRIAKDLLGDVRAAVGELRSPTPPLRAALEALTADLPRPAVHLSVADGADIDAERTRTLVRCVQEIVTNAVRHADAQNLWIEVACTADGTIHLHAHDDGRGARELRAGNGLTGIRERVEQLGGAVSFESTGGFTLDAAVPGP